MPSSHAPKELVAGALAMLKAIGEGDSANAELLSWIEIVHRLGLAEACKARPKLASKFTDTMVTEAINAISNDNRQWPRRPEKLEEVARIISGRSTKAQIRLIASSKPPETA
ncbi:MAG: hypothetical protein JWN50_620 [Parcubacteria group bacterium]|nr:hypothetical protein [Parcubacteria group bacterium]